MKKVIYGILMAALALAVGIATWGTTRSVRLDAITLNENGAVLNEANETIQFTNEDMLYRSWNNEQTLLDKTEEKEILDFSTMLFYDSKNILFTDTTAVVDEAGISSTLEARAIYHTAANNSSFQSETGQTKIIEKQIVKVANRKYFLPAQQGTIYLNGVEKETVTNPLFLIDKAGNAIVFDGNKKMRYYGHVVYQVDAEHIFDVSNEIYTIKGNDIDMTRYGGTDNEKLVIEDTAELTTQNNTTGNNDSDSEDTGNSNGNAGDSIKSQLDKLPSLEDIQAIKDEIDKINAGIVDHKIPKVEISSYYTKATSLQLDLAVNDPDNTIIGQIQVSLYDQNEFEVATQHVENRSGYTEFAGLQPNKAYKIKFAYQFDLGDGNGTQHLAFVAVNNVMTQSISPLYYITPSSTSAIVRAQIDTEIADLVTAHIIVKQNNATLEERLVDVNTLISAGADIQFTGLMPVTEYQVQLILLLQNGATITLKDRTFTTLVEARMATASASMRSDDVLLINYEWIAPDYEIYDTSVDVSKKQFLFNEGVAYTIIQQSPNNILIAPDLPELQATFKVVLTIQAKSIQTNEMKTFDYVISKATKYQNNNLLKLNTQNAIAEQAMLDFTFQSSLLQNEYLLRFEKKPSNTEQWEKISEHIILAETDDIVMTSESFIPNENENYRVVVYQSGKIINYTYYQQ